MAFAGLDFDLSWLPGLSSKKSARNKIRHFSFGFNVLRGRHLMSGFPPFIKCF
jgi:hypothetical protein